MRRLVIALVVGGAVGMAGPGLSVSTASAANNEIDYFGKNLFAGVAYHRWGCMLDGPYTNSTVQTNNTYQGFTGTQYCYAGWTWAQENSSASTYYGCASSVANDIANGCAKETPGGFSVTNTAVRYQWTTTSGYSTDDWLGLYFAAANYDYGLPLIGASGGDWHNYSHSVQSGYTNNSTFDINSRDPSDALNYCSYNVLTNCNSDCWIYDFSYRQGAICPTLSPCW